MTLALLFSSCVAQISPSERVEREFLNDDDDAKVLERAMNEGNGPLTRVTKPLRCTSLHQSILARSPSGKNASLSICHSPAASNDQGSSSSSSSGDDDDDDDASKSDGSSRDEDMFSDVVNTPDDATSGSASYLDLRRHGSFENRHHRRPSSGGLLNRHKALTLTHASPSTAAHAIKEVHTRRGSKNETADTSGSPEVERANFLAELPDAIARARKVHYRRDALLPKTKSFNRVQNSLKEDNAPFEADIKKEATLAKILKEKAATGTQEDVTSSHIPQDDGHKAEPHGLLESCSFPNMFEHSSDTPPRSNDAHGLSEREDTLFTMEDINTSSPKCLTSPARSHVEGSVAALDSRHPRSSQARSARASKRKNEETRYEPYNMSFNKRRAISPSPSSPLGSPNVKGSIFRIEDLTL